MSTRGTTSVRPARRARRGAARGALAIALALASAACGGGSGTPPPPAPGFAFADAVTGLGLATDVAWLPDGRVLVTEKAGALRIAAPGGAPSTAGAFEVDTESEKGLLGVVVDPAFATTRRVILYLSAADGAADPGTDLDRNRVISIELDAAAGRVVAGTERVLVRDLRGPANHDGGGLALGPEGHLYVGTGDSGLNSGQAPEPPYTPTNYFGTCLTNANGKVLRVALDGTIPPDNPLAGVAEATACADSARTAPSGLAPPRRDLWAWGFRNAWRLAFDPESGRLWVGDVGEVTYEELTIVERGRHHGWPWREGGRGWPVSRCRETVPPGDAPGGDCVDPVYSCGRTAAGGIDGGCRSITGGAFLPRARWPAPLGGRYLFADNVTGALWILTPTADRRGVVPGSRVQVGEVPGAVSIRTGPDGDLYVVSIGGRVVRVSPTAGP
jgi:glucose/arabinose dehydrogenase